MAAVFIISSRDVISDIFFFQAEDGIRDRNVTGVQTCALPISAPILRRAEDRRPRRLPGEACRVVDLLADENPRARLAAGLKTQQSIAHSSSFSQAKARFMRRIQSSNAIIWSVRNFRVVSSVSFPSANLLAAMPMNTSGFTSQC